MDTARGPIDWAEKVSMNFRWSEFLFSQTAERLGIDNEPSAAIEANIRSRLAPGMEKVRKILGNVGILISSGYRSERLNAEVNGSKTSDHKLGLSADFTAPRFGSPLQICVALRAAKERGEIEFDQLIFEYGRWVHIGFGPRMRGEVFTITNKGKSPGLPSKWP